MVCEILSEESWTVDCGSAVVAVQQRSRQLAKDVGLTPEAVEAVAIAVSELARNIVVHAGQGEMRLQTVLQGARRGVVATASDKGPGIHDVAWAMADGSTSGGGGLGCGLPAAHRLMDEFKIQSEVGRGTVVEVKKWARKSSARR